MCAWKEVHYRFRVEGRMWIVQVGVYSSTVVSVYLSSAFYVSICPHDLQALFVGPKVGVKLDTDFFFFQICNLYF